MTSADSPHQSGGCSFRCLLVAAILACVFPIAGGDALASAEPQPSASIPFDQLGVEAQRQYSGEGMGITPTAAGAKLRAVLQDLEGEVTPEGLWLTSTADEDLDKPNCFRLSAALVGRETSVALLPKGSILVGNESVSWVRPGLVEEYRVSGDGVRQDFVVLERPAGAGELSVVMEVTGARAEAADYGAKLTIEATGRELAYHRLHVTDASGCELSAHMEVLDSGRLAVRVDDAGAVYPVRIDPTFSDADWIVLNPDAPDISGSVDALVVDGNGNLYVGGSFSTAGGIAASCIARWSGSAWSALGLGINGGVGALAVDGSGNVYAGGGFSTAGGVEANGVAMWNGSVWSALGSGMDDGVVYALVVDESDILYAGGWFNTAGGVEANCIARWNGSAWSILGSGMDGSISALAVDGSGNLYAGGWFNTAGGVEVNNIAKWNGYMWSALGDGVSGGSVSALAVDASGDLYAGGGFTMAGDVEANNIAKWDSSTWSPLDSGVEGGAGSVMALVVDGSGNVWAGGWFTAAGGVEVNGIAKWDGSTWSAVGSGIGHVYALAVDGNGTVYTGRGDNGIAKWNGSAWSALDAGLGINSSVSALIADGDGNLYVGGGFSTAGGIDANRIAKWNGSAWSTLGLGFSGGDVHALAVDGSGNLYAGGSFTIAGGMEASRIARWNGSAWSALGSGVNDESGYAYVNALAADDFGNLYAGGSFTTAGGEDANSIAQWDGSAWSALGLGMETSQEWWTEVGSVNALAVDGGGNLYAGGWFNTAGGVEAHNIAKWNGSTWSALGSGMEDEWGNTYVYALAVDGSGNLYAGGYFGTADDEEANSIARWNGSEWLALGSGIEGEWGSYAYVYALAVDGGGNLYAGGFFMSAGGVGANGIAKWNGVEWSALGSGVDGSVFALALDGANLYAGGRFGKAGNKISPHLAQANLTGGDDTDKDGLSNCLEWAFGLDPNTPNALPFTLMHNGDSIEYHYTRSVAAVAAGATFTVEWHEDLKTGSWSTAGVASGVISDNGLIQHVKATLPPGSAGRRFVRIKLTIP